jgi:hypothetical protein
MTAPAGAQVEVAITAAITGAAAAIAAAPETLGASISHAVRPDRLFTKHIDERTVCSTIP